MIFSLFKKKPDLAKRCQSYLEAGPPATMTTYVPGSLTEIIIAHGANQETLNPELREIASLILLEANEASDSDDNAVARYMNTGAELVREIINAQSS